MLHLRTSLEAVLSTKRVKRRVQAFVLIAIVIFVGAGFAANRYLTAATDSPEPAPSPAGDAILVPSPQGTAATPMTLTPPPERPSATPSTPAQTIKRAPMKHPSPTASSAPPASSSPEAEAVRLTNAERAKHGCPALRTDADLRTAARRHSADMRDRDYFDHVSPDGESPWDRIKAAGYRSPGAENIAKGYPTAEAVVRGWMDSRGHRMNILNCDLKAVGIGLATGGDGGPFWTQDFGFR